MGRPILLLSDMVPGAALADMIEVAEPGREVSVITSRAALDGMFAGAAPDKPLQARLIGFFTSVLVPRRYLDALACAPINFHPGTPDYPGKRSLAFALHDRAPEFGVTAHVMVPKVDSGPIVAVSRFPVPDGAAEPWLRYRTFRSGFSLFRRLMPALLRPDDPPALPDARWGDRDCSESAFQRLEAGRQ
ncbi:formyltransferase family protein [Thalassobaculum sp.]|uniref:formyltransferase family protein n=1 Tax=Thalassobaculum sp. TaxID=2022740 RepID=UPI0032EDDB67